MTEDEKQAVVGETDGQAQPAPEETGAQEPERDPLEEYLSQYDESVSQPEPQTETQPEPKADDALERRLAALEQQNAKLETEQDMKDVVKKIRGDTDFGSDNFVKAWVDAEASDDPRLQQAWMNRHQNPKAFAGVLEGLAGKYSAELKSMPDRNATEDRMAVAAAVRGASKKAPDPGDEIDVAAVRQMNDAEFEAWTKTQARSK